jgi:very-long-chain enoyl-CoA reductase
LFAFFVLAATRAERKYYVERQEFRLKPASDAAAVGGKPAKPVAIKGDDKPLKEFAPNDKSLKLVFKDLGAQISWRTVFLVEYFGPLFIHPLLYYFPQFFYSAAPTQKHEIQTYALALWASCCAFLILVTSTLFSCISRCIF